jgi:hypothetical protein
MVMIDLGIPPGFDLLSENRQPYQQKSGQARSVRLEKFNVTAKQAILYVDSLGPGETVTLPFRLRARHPIRAPSLVSRVYKILRPRGEFPRASSATGSAEAVNTFPYLLLG